MTQRDIQRAIMRERYRRSTVCPNYTPVGWFECDVFELTAAGYFREFEIKLTRSDFLADVNKCQSRWNGQRTELGFTYENYYKHAALASRSDAGPVEFWYVCPEGMIDIGELPEWAGLLECKSRAGRPASCMNMTVVRRAPRLHDTKAYPGVVAHAKGIFYWRFQNLFIHHGRESEVSQQEQHDIDWMI